MSGSGEDDDDDANDKEVILNAKLQVAEQKLYALLSTARGKKAIQVCILHSMCFTLSL